MNKGAPTRASRALIVWLIAEGETPRSAAAAEKLRLSATRRKASIPSSAPWGIVKSCFKALADYRGLSICATAPKKVAQRNERNLSHGQIGRASCRERVCQYVSIPVAAGTLKKKQKKSHIN